MSKSLDVSKWKNLPPPPGFSQSTPKSSSSKSVTTTPPSSSYAALKDKRAWDLAISPAKSLPMQAFMLYMSGGGVQIFSMGIVFVLLSSPFKNLAGINTAFAPFASTPIPSSRPRDKSIAAASSTSLTTLPLQKLIYILCNILTLALGLWKCRAMGLLPTGTGDWLAFESRGPPAEIMLI